MAQIPLYRSQNNGFNWASGFGFYVKVSAAPASDMTLLDLDGAGLGYLRVKMTAGLIVVLETLVNGFTTSVTANPGGALSPTVWYWIAVAGLTPVNNWDEAHQIAIYSRNGSQLYQASQPSRQLGNSLFATNNYRVGIGVSLTTAYLGFPNNPGLDEMSKLEIVLQCAGLLGPPASDPTGLAYYNARQTVGVALTLTDGSGSYSAAAGPLGLTINLDGPFA